MHNNNNALKQKNNLNHLNNLKNEKTCILCSRLEDSAHWYMYVTSECLQVDWMLTMKLI